MEVGEIPENGSREVRNVGSMESGRWNFHLLYKFDAKVKVEASARKATGAVALEWPKVMEGNNVEQDSLNALIELLERLELQVRGARENS